VNAAWKRGNITNVTQRWGKMPWETRIRGGQYYTRSRRVSGRVIREYFGSGSAGEEAAREDRERREAREQQRAMWQGEEEDLATLSAQLAVFNNATDVLLRAVLYASGYHLHKRGEWRRHRA